MAAKTEPCWVCGDLDIVYTDVLDLTWCRKCHDDIYWGEDL